MHLQRCRPLHHPGLRQRQAEVGCSLGARRARGAREPPRREARVPLPEHPHQELLLGRR